MKKKHEVTEERKIEFIPVEEPRSLQARTRDTSIVPQDDLLETSLSRDIEQESNIKTVSKELFSKENIELKTEVSHDEINQITRLRFLKSKFPITNIDYLIDSFLSLRVSKKRKSREEFVNSLQTENKNSQGGNIWNRLMGGNGGTP